MEIKIMNATYPNQYESIYINNANQLTLQKLQHELNFICNGQALYTVVGTYDEIEEVYQQVLEAIKLYHPIIVIG